MPDLLSSSFLAGVGINIALTAIGIIATWKIAVRVSSTTRSPQTEIRSIQNSGGQVPYYVVIIAILLVVIILMVSTWLIVGRITSVVSSRAAAHIVESTQDAEQSVSVQEYTPTSVSSPSLAPTPTSTVGPTPTPTPIYPLGRQIQVADLISDSEARSTAFLQIVRDAVLLEDHWTAIQIAASMNITGTQARALLFVVHCAIEDREHLLAGEAAKMINANNYRDKAMKAIVDSRSQVAPTRGDSDGARDGRASMECMNFFPD